MDLTKGGNGGKFDYNRPFERRYGAACPPWILLTQHAALPLIDTSQNGWVGTLELFAAKTKKSRQDMQYVPTVHIFDTPLVILECFFCAA
jgi:hypothetical protein